MDKYAQAYPTPAHASVDMYMPASKNPAGKINSIINATAPSRFGRLNIFLKFSPLSMKKSFMKTAMDLDRDDVQKWRLLKV